MQAQIYVQSDHQKVIDGVIEFFNEKNHSVDQVGYCLIVSLKPTYDGENELDGVNLYTKFYLVQNSDNDLTAGLGLSSHHCEENIKAMVEEYLNQFDVEQKLNAFEKKHGLIDRSQDVDFDQVADKIRCEGLR